MKTFEIVWHKILNITVLVSVICLLSIMLLTFSDVIGRYVFDKPLTGAYEGTQYLQAIVVFMGAAWTQFRGGHVKVEILSSRMSENTNKWLDVFVPLIAMILMAIMGWKTSVQAVASFISGEYESITTQFLQLWIPKGFVALGSWLLGIEFLVELINGIKALRVRR